MKTEQTHTPGPLNFHSRCGCKLTHPPEGAVIVYCKVHAAAPDLLKAAREVITFPFDQKPREALKDAIGKIKS